VPVLRVGDVIRLSDFEYEYAKHIGIKRNAVGGSQSRTSKRDDVRKHIMGTVGEVALCVALGLPIELVQCLDRASSESDITCTQPHLEAKNGWPISYKKTHKRGATYVVLRQIDIDGRLLRITHIAPGVMCNKEPKRLPIPGTERMNWDIPSALQEIDIIIKDYAKGWIESGEKCA
jgi:hypothetical protein